MGEIKISGNTIVSDTGQTLMYAQLLSGIKTGWKIQLPINKKAGQTTIGDVWTFLGALTELDKTVSYDKVQSFSGTVKVSGLISIVAGS